MNTKHFLIAILIMLLGNHTQAQVPATDKKILVAYFSHSGNTQAMAEMIKEKTGADIFEIIPTASYPTDYNTVVAQAKEEINRKYKPAIKGKVENMDSYDIVIVGSPNWWSTIAPPVATFLTSYDLKSKTIVPFMTHEGTRMGHSVEDIKELCPDSEVLPGLPVRGSNVSNAGADIDKWLKDTGIIK